MPLAKQRRWDDYLKLDFREIGCKNGKMDEISSKLCPMVGFATSGVEP
jgi:hypothetical protein